MINGFTRADAKVKVHEGGYVNHPSDPGGETNQGVTRRVYDLYRRAKGLPVRSVRHLTEEERLDIYRTRYWSVIKADSLPEGVDYVVYDGAVNSGPVQSVKWLQRALGRSYTGKVDGIVGPETIRAAKAHPNHDALIRDICDQRMAFLRALKTWNTFGRGWTRRVDEVREQGQLWASGDSNAHVPATPTPGKGVIEDAKTPPPAEVGTGAAAGGVASGGLAGTLQTLQEQLTPYSSASGWIENLVVGLIVVGAVLTIGGLAYRAWAARRTAQLNEALA